MPNKKHILLVQPLIGIGDMVWHKPWIDAFAKRHHVTLMAKSSAQAKAVFLDQPSIKHLTLERSERGKKGIHDGLFGFFRLVRMIRKTQADSIYILHKSWRYAAAAYVAGIKERYGYGHKKQRFFLTSNMTLPPQKGRIHPRKNIEDFCALHGIKLRNTQPTIKANPKTMSAFKKDYTAPIIILGVGAADEVRRWSPKRFAELITRIEKQKKCTIILAGAPSEQIIGKQICDQMEQPPYCLFTQPLEKIINLLAAADLYIGNDTSLCNLSIAVSTKTFRIFASTLPILESPLATTFCPKDKSRLDVPGSINDVTAKEVAEAALDFFQA